MGGKGGSALEREEACRLLGVPEDSSFDTARRAYDGLVNELLRAPERDPYAFQLINEAWAVLQAHEAERHGITVARFTSWAGSHPWRAAGAAGFLLFVNTARFWLPLVARAQGEANPSSACDLILVAGLFASVASFRWLFSDAYVDLGRAMWPASRWGRSEGEWAIERRSNRVVNAIFALVGCAGFVLVALNCALYG